MCKVGRRACGLRKVLNKLVIDTWTFEKNLGNMCGEVLLNIHERLRILLGVIETWFEFNYVPKGKKMDFQIVLLILIPAITVLIVTIQRHTVPFWRIIHDDKNNCLISINQATVWRRFAIVAGFLFLILHVNIWR